MAVEGLKTPNQGVFAIGRVVLPTSQGQKLNGVPIAVLELIGTTQNIVVPLKNGGDKFDVDDHMLIVGVHDASVMVRLNDNLTPLVRTKFVLATAKD